MWDLIVSVPDRCLSFYFSASFPSWFLVWFWQPIKFSGLDKGYMFVEYFSINFSEKLLPKYLQRVAINANFHFSQYKSIVNGKFKLPYQPKYISPALQLLTTIHK